MENSFPIARLLTPGEPQPWRILSLNDAEWWKQVEPAEWASHERRLQCPFCDRPFQYCSGQVLKAYFRHPPGVGTCKGPSTSSSGGPTSYPPIRTMWIRHSFAQLLRHILPAGAELDDKPALTRLDDHMTITFPGGRQMAVEIDCHTVGISSLRQRVTQHEVTGRAVVWVFAGEGQGGLLPRYVAAAANQVETTLDPLVQTIMRHGPFERPKARAIVDQAYRTFSQRPNVQGWEYGSLLFYQPSKVHLGTLIGLRGLTPARRDVWSGAVVRTNVVKGEPHTVRFGQQGIFFAQDVAMVKRLRHYRHGLRRREWARQEALRQEQIQAENDRPQISPTSPSPVTTSVPSSRTLSRLTHRIERAGPIVIFAGNQFGRQWYIVRQDGPIAVVFEGKSYRCAEISPGTADKEIRRYRKY